MSNFEYNYNNIDTAVRDFDRLDYRNINEVSSEINDHIKELQDNQIAWGALKNVIESYNRAINYFYENSDILSKILKYKLPYQFFNKEHDTDEVEEIPLDKVKEEHETVLRYYNALIDIWQKYYEDVNEFLQEAERLREEGKDEEAEVYENRVKWVWLLLHTAPDYREDVMRRIYHPEELKDLYPWY